MKARKTFTAAGIDGRHWRFAGCGSATKTTTSNPTKQTNTPVQVQQQLTASQAVDAIVSEDPGYLDEFAQYVSEAKTAGLPVEAMEAYFDRGYDQVAGTLPASVRSEMPSAQDIFNELMSRTGS